MKLVMSTLPLNQKCKLCDKIDTKKRRFQGEQDRVRRWEHDGGKFRASIEKSQATMAILQKELYTLINEREAKKRAITSRP